MPSFSPDLVSIAVGIVGAVFGFIGIVIAIYQTKVTEKARDINKKLEVANKRLDDANTKLNDANTRLRTAAKQKNAAHCRTLFATVKILAENITGACAIVTEDCRMRKRQECTELSTKIKSALDQTRELGTFCSTLDREHKEEYSESIDSELVKTLEEIRECIGLGAHHVPEQEPVRQVSTRASMGVGV